MVLLVASSCTWLYWLLAVVHGFMVAGCQQLYVVILVASSCTWFNWLLLVVHGCAGC